MRKLLFAALAVLAVGSFAIAPAFADGVPQGTGNTGQGNANSSANGGGNQGQGASGGDEVAPDNSHNGPGDHGN